MAIYDSITIPYLLWVLGVRPLSRVYSYYRVRSGKPLAPKNRRYRAMILIGSVIKAEAVVEFFDGRFYTVRVSAKDGTQEIGRGTVGRAIVSVSTFLERVKKQE